MFPNKKKHHPIIKRILWKLRLSWVSTSLFFAVPSRWSLVIPSGGVLNSAKSWPRRWGLSCLVVSYNLYFSPWSLTYHRTWKWWELEDDFPSPGGVFSSSMLNFTGVHDLIPIGSTIHCISTYIYHIINQINTGKYTIDQKKRDITNCSPISLLWTRGEVPTCKLIACVLFGGDVARSCTIIRLITRCGMIPT